MFGSCYSFCRNVQDRVMLTFLSTVLSRKNSTPWKNGSAGNSATQVFFCKTSPTVVFSKSRHVLPVSSLTMLEGLHSGLKFIKLVLFTTSPRIFVIQNKNKVPNWGCMASIQWPTGQICATLFFFLALPGSLWHLSFPTRNQTQARAVNVQRPNHWLARECLLPPSWFFLRRCQLGFVNPEKNNKECAMYKEDCF